MVRVVDCAGGATLVITAADGAGSARLAEVGAAVACEALQVAAAAWLGEHGDLHGLSRDALVRWMMFARSEVVRRAEELSARPRDLACTAILAVVGVNAAAFAQVGDGAVVVPDAHGYAAVFWPAPAEYANLTDFLTDEGVEDRIACETGLPSMDQVAVFSDGLQRLALDYSTRRGHPGFFTPLFAAVQAPESGEELGGLLRTFLNSSQINARTDDDKTLVIAARIAPAPPAPC